MDRLTDYDDQDRELGMNTYCLCCEHQITTYGGITRWTLTDRQLQVWLSLTAQEELQVQGGFLITHSLEPARLEPIRTAMHRILER